MQNIRKPIIMALASLLVLGAGPRDAVAEGQAGTCGPELVPLVLTGTGTPEPYVLPTCSKCKKVKLERQSTSTGGTQGVLGLTYHGEPGEFVGDIELTLVLADDTEHVVTIEGVWLVEGDQATWVIEGPRWEEAETAWLAFVPAA